MCIILSRRRYAENTVYNFNAIYDCRTEHKSRKSIWMRENGDETIGAFFVCTVFGRLHMNIDGVVPFTCSLTHTCIRCVWLMLCKSIDRLSSNDYVDTGHFDMFYSVRCLVCSWLGTRHCVPNTYQRWYKGSQFWWATHKNASRQARARTYAHTHRQHIHQISNGIVFRTKFNPKNWILKIPPNRI